MGVDRGARAVVAEGGVVVEQEALSLLEVAHAHTLFVADVNFEAVPVGFLSVLGLLSRR